MSNTKAAREIRRIVEAPLRLARRTTDAAIADLDLAQQVGDGLEECAVVAWVQRLRGVPDDVQLIVTHRDRSRRHWEPHLYETAQAAPVHRLISDLGMPPLMVTLARGVAF